MKKLITCLIGALYLQFGFAQIPGTLDPGFNTADNSNFGNGPGPLGTIVYASAVQPNGKIIIGGDFTTYHGLAAPFILRLNADGSRDAGFSVNINGPQYQTRISAIALQQDGKILIGGSFRQVNGVSANTLKRLNPDGSTDNSFNTGADFDGVVNSILILPDGKIAVGGNFSYQSRRQSLALMNADGSPVSQFNSLTSLHLDGTVTCIAKQQDGKLLLGGSFLATQIGGQFGIRRINLDGSRDFTFLNNQITGGVVNAIVVQPDGNIVTGGNFRVVNGQIRIGIVRLQADGRLDNSFSIGDGFAPANTPNGIIKAIKLQPDGKILAGGFFQSYNGLPANCIIRINSNGSQDLSFRHKVDPMTSGSPPIVHCISLVENSKVLVGGFLLPKFFRNDRNNLFLLDLSGNVVRSFNPRRGFNDLVMATVMQPDGKMLVAGRFTAYNDTPALSLLRLLPNGSIDPTYNIDAGINGQIYAAALQPDGKLLIAGNFTNIGKVVRRGIARLHANGTIDETFSVGAEPNDSIKSFMVREDGRILVAGAFTQIGGFAKNRVALLNANGTVVSAFGFNGANGTINYLLKDENNKVLIGGAFTNYNGSNAAGIARLLESGNMDGTFLPPSNFTGLVSAMARSGNDIIATGTFTHVVNGIARKSITRLTNNGNVAPGFNVGTGFGISQPSRVTGLAVQADGRILVTGIFNHYNTISLRNTGVPPIALRLLSNGLVDNSFPFIFKETRQYETDSLPYIITLQHDGNIVLSGDFYSINNTTKRRIARLLNPGAANDEPCGAINLTPANPGDSICHSLTTGSLLLSTKSAGFNSNVGGDVWYKFTATSTSHFVKAKSLTSTYEYNFQLEASLFRGSNCGTLQSNFSAYANETVAGGGLLLGFKNLTIDSVYYIRLSSSIGSAKDFRYQLCVLTPLNDEPCYAQNLIPGIAGDSVCSNPTTGSLLLSTKSDAFNGNVGGDVWYKFTATSTSHFVKAKSLTSTYAYNFQLEASLFRGSNCGTLHSNFSAYENETVAGGGLLLGFKNLTIDSVYYIRLSSSIGSAQDFKYQLCVLTPLNDEPCYAQNLIPGIGGDSVCSNPATGSLLLSTKSDAFNGNVGGDVWYKFTATSTSHFIKAKSLTSTYAYNFQLEASLFRGSNCGTLQSNFSAYANETVAGGGLLLGFKNLTIDSVYYIRLSSSIGSAKDFRYQLCVLTPLNDEPCYAQNLIPGIGGDSVCSNPTTGSLLLSTKSDAFNGNVGGDVWYKFTATSTSHFVKAKSLTSTYAYNFQLEASLFRGSNCGTLHSNFSAYENETVAGGGLLLGFKNLTIDSVYYIRLSSSIGSAKDLKYQLCVLTPPESNPCEAILVTPATPGDTSMVNSIVETFSNGLPGVLNNCDGNIKLASERWYKFTATAARHIIRYTGKTNYEAAVYTGTGCSINTFSRLGCVKITRASQTQTISNLQPGSLYYLRIGIDSTSKANAVNDTFSFRIFTPPTNEYNDSICNAISLGNCANTTGHLLFATPDVPGSVCGVGRVSEVWYKFTAPVSGIISVQSTTSGFRPKVRFITLSDCNNPASIISENCDFNDLIQMTEFIPGTEYYMGVGVSEADATVMGQALNFRVQLVNNTLATVQYTISTGNSICEASAVIFNATSANAGLNPGYEWLINNVFTGATGASFICDSLKNGDQVRVRVVPAENTCQSPRLSQSTTFTVTPGTLYFEDADDDGYGRKGTDSVACTPPIGYVTNSSDCNDADNAKNTSFGFYVDSDGDGFGINPLVQICSANAGLAPAGYSINNFDLDDNDANINPNSPAAEYFIDKDPGTGKGQPINFSVINDSIVINDNISIENLKVGFHTLGIRLLNAGNWSLFETRGFYVDSAENETNPIVKGEYYYDSDPGTGKALDFFPEILDDTANAALLLPAETLKPGFHYVALRTLDQSGKWSIAELRGFYVDSLLTKETQPIVSTEYYFDTDPGVGNATSINIPPSDTFDINEQFAASLLQPGFHYVTLRSKSADGHWGMGEARGFYVQPNEINPNPITAAEYFLTQDPGSGNANVISIPQPVDTIKNISPIIIPSSVPVGTYLMGLRVKDQSGAWSLFETDTVTVTSNATNLSIPFTQICAGLSTDISFTANGPYNTANVFTAQLSNGFGDFSSPVNIGSISTNISGTFTITIPVNTSPGLNYRIRIASSSPASASVISGNGFAISGSLTSADANTIQTLSATEASHLVDANCRMITSIFPNGELPISGSVSARVWVEDNVPLNNGVPYVGRHYEITPNLNGSIATARVTLYFRQTEFDAYNNHPNTNSFERLPASPADASGKANLLIFKYSGASSDGSGLPSTYPNDIFVIDPEDENIIWNETLQRWEVSFDVTGFSGFIVSTSPSFILGPEILYTNWIGNISEEWEDPTNWSHGVPTATTIAIIPAGRPNYPTVSVSTTVKGVVAYEGTTVIVNDGVVVTVVGK